MHEKLLPSGHRSTGAAFLFTSESKLHISIEETLKLILRTKSTCIPRWHRYIRTRWLEHKIIIIIKSNFDQQNQCKGVNRWGNQTTQWSHVRQRAESSAKTKRHGVRVGKNRALTWTCSGFSSERALKRRQVVGRIFTYREFIYSSACRTSLVVQND